MGQVWDHLGIGWDVMEEMGWDRMGWDGIGSDGWDVL